MAKGGATSVNDPEKRPFPMRRLVFAGFLVVVMAISTGAALGFGYAIVQTVDSSLALGTIALVVAPALTFVAILGTVLVNLLRDDKN